MTERKDRTVYQELRQAIEQAKPVVAVTVLRGPRAGSKMLVFRDGTVESLGTPDVDRQIVDIALKLLDDSRSETMPIEIEGELVDVFFESFPAAPLLLIFGAVHVAQALSRFASMMGFRIVVVDVREKLASADRFPEADEIITAWPDVALEGMDLDSNTYIAVLSHDPKFDEPALLGALKSPAIYVGAVGSRKTKAGRRERLLEAGLDEADIDRIRGPIGLDIGASTPEEMAISILAEMIAVRNGRHGAPLVEGSGRIRARV